MQTIYLRVSDELKQAIEKKAGQEGMSVNEFASCTLAEAAEEDGGAPAVDVARFDVEATINILKSIAAASDAMTIQYGQLAARHGHDWGPKVRNALVLHLGHVWTECRRRGLPSLTSLVVAKADGKPATGFLRLERESGRVIGDEDAAAFVAEQQAACRAWARSILNVEGGVFDPWPQLRGLWKGPSFKNYQDFMRGAPDETAPA